MKRIILTVIKCIFRLPYWWLYKVKKLSNHDKYTYKDGYAFIHHVAPTVIKRARVNLKVYGLENIPQNEGVLFTPNHQGLFDPIAMFSSLDIPVRAVVKEELTHTVLVKDVIKMLDYVPIDRKDFRQSAKVIKYVSKQLEAGESFLIYPEGTRSKEGNKLLEFKGGTFKIATKSHATIVPVAMIDCFKVFDVNTIKKITVQIHYLKPIRYEEYQDMHTNDIAMLVQSRIEEAIKEYSNEN
ncbi:MAG: lysophospholipid acyltransferase family protein [Thomasclavelia sp.]|jgi:1-acyl-sn-glycerol-3-phosphate acyltransferase|nr:lysophospholipid acyltransferase family protein [Thomasclavelia sp.]